MRYFLAKFDFVGLPVQEPMPVAPGPLIYLIPVPTSLEQFHYAIAEEASMAAWRAAFATEEVA